MTTTLGYIHKTLNECCENHFGWIQSECITNGNRASDITAPTLIGTGQFFPAWGVPNETCVQDTDGSAPEYMVAFPSGWLHDDLESCCQTYFSWNYEACVK